MVSLLMMIKLRWNREELLNFTRFNAENDY